jgi:hypothetical protein
MVTEKPSALDRLAIWLSTSRNIDGLWVGTFESEPQLGLRRVGDALELIKRYNSLHYSRVIHNLDRVWVNVLPDAAACYQRSLNACVFDERFVRAETTTLEQIATSIIHEATHARLERWGVSYEEKLRPRIEAICLRRELAFAASLPDSAQLQEDIARTVEWCAANPDYFSGTRFRERDTQGRITALRYLGTPNWIVRAMLNSRPVIFAVRRLVRRLKGR